MKKHRGWLYLLLFMVVVTICGRAYSADTKAAAGPMKAVPHVTNPQIDETARQLLGGGGNQGGKKGDEGLKAITDLKFDIGRKPGLLDYIFIKIALGIAGFLLNVLILVVVITLIVRALKRKRTTGSFVPEDSLLVAAFDVAKAKIDARHKELVKELKVLQKRTAAQVNEKKAKKTSGPKS